MKIIETNKLINILEDWNFWTKEPGARHSLNRPP